MGFFSKLFGKKADDNKKQDVNNTANKSEAKTEELIIYSPVNGKFKLLKDVSDPVFAEEMTGKGVAIIPADAEKVVLSPVKDGEVKVAFPTGHAYGIKTPQGPELLVHIGLDTVELDGKGFVKKVDVDSKINLTTELCDMDLGIIKEHEKETDVIVIATNDSISGFEIKNLMENGSDVKVGDPIFKVVKK